MFNNQQTLFQSVFLPGMGWEEREVDCDSDSDSDNMDCDSGMLGCGKVARWQKAGW